MASTASSRSILPQPPLVCHIPFSTRHMSRESFPFFSVTRKFDDGFGDGGATHPGISPVLSVGYNEGGETAT
ncbi:hypothetical protein D8674_040772 [Pyrus ussuriensis x Pyrus communis]|uniref:Uncharacterized protein n=1 Tax=Pyrus ussuriensis x Pyrus communis TaxID=2448454 RepID=A0A5N5GFU8_9ROSA|nr:hypothetical protein D8674_040772 [Pyrus ussuriensis x Pyrus communis]